MTRILDAEGLFTNSWLTNAMVFQFVQNV